MGVIVFLFGFGYFLVKGVIEEVNRIGFVGVFIGGVLKIVGGIFVVVFFGYVILLIFNLRSK